MYLLLVLYQYFKTEPVTWLHRLNSLPDLIIIERWNDNNGLIDLFQNTTQESKYELYVHNIRGLFRRRKKHLSMV